MMRTSLHLKTEHVLTVGTVFGRSPLILELSRFRAWHLEDRAFPPSGKNESHRSEQEC